MPILARAVLICACAALLAAAAFSAASLTDLALYLACLAAFTAAGWPLSRWFAGSGRDWLSRLVLAVGLGYVAGAAITVALRAVGVASPAACFAACLGLAAALQWTVPRRSEGVVPLARFGPADQLALGVLWLVVAVLVGPVFARVGQPTPAGLAFRAYFVADLWAHMCVVGELAKGACPPLNPFLPAEPLPYYWPYFSLPGMLAMLRPEPLLHHAILPNDTLAAALFVAVGHLVVRSLNVSALASAGSWSVLLLANSFEALAYLQRAGLGGLARRTFRTLNVDAVTRWYWSLPGADGFHRMMWWTPQHEMALALGLLVIAAAVLARDRSGVQRGLADGLLLGGAVAYSTINGLLLVLAYAGFETVMLAIDRGRDLRRWVAARAIAAGMVLGVAGLLVAVGMVQRTPGMFIFGWNRHFLLGPWRFFLYSFGPALFFAPLALPALRRRWRLAVALASVVAVSTAAFLYVDLRGHENAYVVFRTSHLWFLVLALLLALAIDQWRAWRRPVRIALTAALILASLAAFPTVALDWYNARDTSNTAFNPGGFRWTLHLTPNEQVAARWIQANLPVTATVQNDPRPHGRATWPLVPAFLERRMGAGAGIFQPNPRRFDATLDAVHAMFSGSDAGQAHALCRRLGVDYVYVGPIERAANGGGIGKFEERPDLFQPVFRLGDEEIFQVVK